MNKKIKNIGMGLLGLVATLGVANAAYVINGNFCSVVNIQNPPAGLNSGSAAWNDLTSTTGGFAATDSTSVLDYTDGSSVSGMNIAWAASTFDTHDNRNTSGFEVTTGHEELFAGYLSGFFSITLSGTGALPALKNKDTAVASYDLYLYMDGDFNTGSYSVTDGTTTFYGSDTSDFITNTDGGISEYVEVTSTSSLSPTLGANYVKFSGITSDDFSITITGTGGPAVLNGFEITAIPEPGTLALAAIMLGSFGGLHLLRRRKKA